MRVVLLLLVTGAAAHARPLYERLGGKSGVAAAVDEWVARATADPRIKGRFLDVDGARLKSGLADFLCAQSGGPCQPRDLSGVWLQLCDEEFGALQEDLGGALKKLNIADAERAELSAALQGSKPQIVSAPPPEALKADTDLVEKARQLASMLRNVGKSKPGELLELAVAARLQGQRSHAEYLYSLAELEMKPGALAIVAPLFRAGGPPRITTPTRAAEIPRDSPPPRSAGEEAGDGPGVANLEGVFTVDKKAQSGVVVLPGGRRRSAPPQTLVMRDGQLAPHLLVVPVGSTVWFANFDPIFHNFYSLAPRPFDLGLYKGGQARPVTFEREGIASVSCNLHPHTAAYVIVVGPGFYRVTDAAGRFSFKGLPLGRYQVRAWSEQLFDWFAMRIEIAPGANQVSLESPAGKSGPAIRITDKFGAPLIK